jgi:uncharacterized protein (TIGR03000 family)
MRHVLLLVVTLTLIAPERAIAQQRAAAADRLPALITVTVPNEKTKLVVEDKEMPGAGSYRTFSTPPLEVGTTHRYTLTATWDPNGYTTMTRTRVVEFRGGDRVAVDLTVSDDRDRVRVIYVPTPDDIVQEMVRLAGVNGNDVVYEPGCGDARITIAAVKAGAKRGVGIDIDPERVADSRARVAAAGLADKVDIRLGDALDIPDLSEATVVLLYMGDHFNLLIRPNLWRQLKVGSRVVSHRFPMGDWKPDKTVSVGSDEGGVYELHLWTVTEEVKRRLTVDR